VKLNSIFNTCGRIVIYSGTDIQHTFKSQPMLCMFLPISGGQVLPIELSAHTGELLCKAWSSSDGELSSGAYTLWKAWRAEAVAVLAARALKHIAPRHSIIATFAICSIYVCKQDVKLRSIRNNLNLFLAASLPALHSCASCKHQAKLPKQIHQEWVALYLASLSFPARERRLVTQRVI
jgi:hypothetical protein